MATTKSTGNLLTPTAYARHRGCTHQAVRQAIAAGRITVERDAKGRPRVDPERADLEWARNTQARKSSQDLADEAEDLAEGLEIDLNTASKSQADTVRARYQAAQQRLEYERESGKLVDRDATLASWAKIVTLARTKILALPSKIKGRIPHLTKAEVATIEKLVREALEDVAEGKA